MNPEIDEIARMLPDLAGPDLSPQRHRELKSHLVSEIGRRRRPSLRLLALAPAAAAALALALVVPSLVRHESSSQDVAYVPAPVIHVPVATTKGVKSTLDRIADAAARQPAPAVGPHQYTYTRSMVSSTRPEQERTFDGPVELIALHPRQTWLPQDLSKTGLIRESGQDETLHVAIDAMNYERLAALPTDPATLGPALHASGRPGPGAGARPDRGPARRGERATRHEGGPLPGDGADPRRTARGGLSGRTRP